MSIGSRMWASTEEVWAAVDSGIVQIARDWFTRVQDQDPGIAANYEKDVRRWTDWGAEPIAVEYAAYLYWRGVINRPEYARLLRMAKLTAIAGMLDDLG